MDASEMMRRLIAYRYILRIENMIGGAIGSVQRIGSGLCTCE
jgi:hypothetical protein